MSSIHNVNLYVRSVESLNDVKFIVSVYILVSQIIGMKRSKWCLKDPNWWSEGSDACPLICGHMPSAHASSKLKGAIVL